MDAVPMTSWLNIFAFISLGAKLTIKLLIGGLTIGIALGTVLAILRYKSKKIVRLMIIQIISLIRGTPMILQLSLIYFALPQIIGISFSPLIAGIITFGINSSAYMAEIFRAGIENLPKGQFEACQSLQIPTYYMWKDIILPQVLKNIFPAMMNETITLVKETALISTIGGMDIMRRSTVVAAEQFTYFAPLFIAGGCYYFIILIIEYISKKYTEKYYAKY